MRKYLCNIRSFRRGSILGPFLFSMLLNDTFLFITSSNLGNYANANTQYSINKNLHVVKFNHEANFAIMERWSFENQIVLNPGKRNINVTENASSNNEKRLGVPSDKKLSFDVHIRILCKKAGQKICVLARISSHLTLDQKLLLINSVTKSQFNYSL